MVTSIGGSRAKARYMVLTCSQGLLYGIICLSLAFGHVITALEYHRMWDFIGIRQYLGIVDVHQDFAGRIRWDLINVVGALTQFLVFLVDSF